MVWEHTAIGSSSALFPFKIVSVYMSLCMFVCLSVCLCIDIYFIALKGWNLVSHILHQSSVICVRSEGQIWLNPV